MANRLTGEKIVFTPDQADIKDLDLVARKLAPLRIKNSSANFSLPSSITLMEMLQNEKVSEVNVMLNWTRNKTYMGMSVPIGVRAGGEALYLDMHETGFGPHGLVAGTTGSGKSELLQSIIVSQAIHYHPHDIAFVLIDYKGAAWQMYSRECLIWSVPLRIWMGIKRREHCYLSKVSSCGGNVSSRNMA